MKNWADDVMRNDGFIEFMSGWMAITFFLFFMISSLFFGGHLIHWVASGEWADNGWDVYGRLCVLAGVAFGVPLSVVLVMATFSKIIDRHNEKVQDYKSKLADFED